MYLIYICARSVAHYRWIKFPQCCYRSKQIRIHCLKVFVLFVFIISNQFMNFRSFFKKIEWVEPQIMCFLLCFLFSFFFFHFHLSRVMGSVGPRTSLCYKLRHFIDFGYLSLRGLMIWSVITLDLLNLFRLLNFYYPGQFNSKTLET